MSKLKNHSLKSVLINLIYMEIDNFHIICVKSAVLAVLTQSEI